MNLTRKYISTQYMRIYVNIYFVVRVFDVLCACERVWSARATCFLRVYLWSILESQPLYNDYYELQQSNVKTVVKLKAVKN